MKIGIIGTGLMGSNLARCLTSKGYDIYLYNRTLSKAIELAKELNCSVASSVTELIDHTDISLLTITGDEALLDVVSGIVFSKNTNSMIINLSTVTPMASEQAYNILLKHGFKYLEAPVYGSTSEARECRLLSIVAGDKEVFENAEKIIQEYSGKVFYVGRIPSASVIKLALNNIGLSTPAILSISLMLLEAWGIEVNKFLDIAKNLWFYKIIERYWNRIVSEKPPRFKVWMAGKDYHYVSSALKYKKLPSELSDAIASMYMNAAANDYMDKDYPLVAKYYRELASRTRK